MNRLIDSNDPLVVKVAAQVTANGRLFSGRPRLAEQLVTPLHGAALSTALLVHKAVQMRKLFEFADHHERSTGHRINSVGDILGAWKEFPDFLSEKGFRWNYETLRTCKKLIEASPDFEGLSLPKENPFPARRRHAPLGEMDRGDFRSWFYDKWWAWEAERSELTKKVGHESFATEGYVRNVGVAVVERKAPRERGS